MFSVKSNYIGRISFASKLFPKLSSSLELNLNKLVQLDAIKSSANVYDGETFCGGRSRNKNLLTFFNFISESPENCSTFAQLTTFRRALKKLVNLIEHELLTIEAHEVLMPTILPQKLWLQSGRLERQPEALNNIFKLTDATGENLLLGPTHEETITKLVANYNLQETDLPLLMFQTSQKFRDESNPRFGLLRCKEFLMNDLYSFDKDLQAADETYSRVSETYKKIFKRLGLDCIRIQSDNGSIGGSYSHEYQLIVSSGEDSVIRCNKCSHIYNVELATKQGNEPDQCINCKSKNDLTEFKALELAHTFLLDEIYSKAFKANYLSQSGNQRYNLKMGCYGIGVSRILGAAIDLLSIVPNTSGDVEKKGFIQLRWPSECEPFKLGIVAPARRSKQFANGSSEFIERLSNRILRENSSVDIVIEDRDKDSLVKRLLNLQSLGIPNILVVGQKFLQDQPEVEVLKLSLDKKSYEQSWLNEEQIYDYLRNLDNEIND